MRSVSTQDELDAIDGPVLFKFSADWCGPCRKLYPIVEALEKEFGHKCTFVSVDVDAAEALCARHRVQQIPYVKILHNGEEIMSAVGPTSDDMRRHLAAL